MIRALLLTICILTAHTMAYEDERAEELATMHNGLGCLTDTECETGVEDAEFNQSEEI